MLGRSAQQERLEYEALRQAYRDVFGGPQGEKVMADIARMGRADKTVLVPGKPDETASLEGRRQLWLYIRAMAAEGDELLRKFQEKE